MKNADKIAQNLDFWEAGLAECLNAAKKVI